MFSKKKGILFGICLVAIFLSVAFLQADKEMSISDLKAEIEANGYTFTVGTTSVSDIPLDQLCGLKVPKNWDKKGNFDGGIESTRAVPASFDLRDSGLVTPITNQGSCGSCWAFGTLASYEGAILFNGGSSEDLSEQWLLDCNSSGYDCDGGWWIFDDLTSGAPKESCYPYVGYQQSCQSGCTKYYPLSAWYYVGSSSSIPSTTDIKNAIYNYGVVGSAVYVNSAFQNYTGGIFNQHSAGQCNHAIALVGWNDVGQYWILKNSWGTGWGESGYMRIEYACNSVGYSACYGIPSGTTPPPDDPYEPNDLAAAAYGPIDSATDYDNADISTSSDEDWFHFTIAEAGTITVSVDHESGADLDWYLYLSTDTSNYLARGYTTSDPEVASYSATTVGKYYVKVIGYNGSTSVYTLRVTYPDSTSPGGDYYKIINRASGYAIDINTGSSYVYHYVYTDTDDKKWSMTSVGDGYYKIENKLNGFALDVGTGNYVYNYVYNGNTDKHWELIDLGTGYYRIKNRYSGYDLDTGTGSYVYHYIWNNGTDKQWQITAVE